ncbi:MAG: DUF1573 domain-containing protein [Dysgonamonadaceae bacterium]|jgi:hypothetical protein|nr:DUF1573 domain-containing protein [Dysgonamonadaceae bacterium]
MLKKGLFLAIILPALAGLSFMAFTTPQDVTPVGNEVKKGIVIADPDHDFGTIKENGGLVSVVFKVTNVSQDDIIVVEVHASCGCTTPQWTKEPIQPGKTGEITATFNPKGRPGPFTKTITATTDKGEKLIMHIRGVVEA